MTEGPNDGLTKADLLRLSAAVPPPAPAATATTQSKRSAIRQISDALVTARQPGMPLDVLAKLVREAPLQSLLIAFLVGRAISRRR